MSGEGHAQVGGEDVGSRQEVQKARGVFLDQLIQVRPPGPGSTSYLWGRGGGECPLQGGGRTALTAGPRSMNGRTVADRMASKTSMLGGPV